MPFDVLSARRSPQDVWQWHLCCAKTTHPAFRKGPGMSNHVSRLGVVVRERSRAAYAVLGQCSRWPSREQHKSSAALRNDDKDEPSCFIRGICDWRRLHLNEDCSRSVSRVTVMCVAYDLVYPTVSRARTPRTRSKSLGRSTSCRRARGRTRPSARRLWGRRWGGRLRGR